MISKLLLNSLYGRFGMDDDFIFTEIMSKKDYASWEKQKGAAEAIVDLIELGKKYLVQIKSPVQLLKTTALGPR